MNNEEKPQPKGMAVLEKFLAALDNTPVSPKDMSFAIAGLVIVTFYDEEDPSSVQTAKASFMLQEINNMINAFLIDKNKQLNPIYNKLN